MAKVKAHKNRTLTLDNAEKAVLRSKIVTADSIEDFIEPDAIIMGDLFQVVSKIPENSVDLLFLDPPYNLNKQFHSTFFNKLDVDDYSQWIDSWFKLLIPLLKDTATVYFCGDWFTSVSIFQVIKKYLVVRNRITWEREKGRGSKTNYKNSHEDIWFATKSDRYTFNLKDIMLKRRVIAPYRENGVPKDWEENREGNFRLTHPGNLWTDITIPFWSMKENTAHPTQKPEKLLAKLILASTNTGDCVLDPFLGSGTTAVTAKKLKRKYLGIEISEDYVLLALKRLELADEDASIQGYRNNVFWERNSLGFQRKKDS